VHGSDGLDEITTTGPSRVAEGRAGVVEAYALDPADLGVERARPADLTGGDADLNAAITRAILKGERGPKREIVLVNAAPAFVAAGKARSLKEGIARAAESVDSGAAEEKLVRLVERTRP